MRVVLTSVHCWPDVRRGGERYLHELAGGLVRAGHDVQVLSTGQRPGRDTVLAAPVHRLPVRRLRRYGELDVQAAFGAQALAHLALPVLRGRWDVWHATSTADGAAAALLGRTHRVRTVFTDHGFPARPSRDARPDRRLHALVAKDIGTYVCVSEAAGAYLGSDYGRAATVIPPGVVWDAHAPAPRDPRPTLLYSGSLTESRKGVGLLLAAAAALRTQVPDLQVWLAGPGSIDVDSDLVTRCGLLDDPALRDAYARAWVTVLPSTAESFGMTVVESLASGTPAVVLRDSGGPAEIVTPGTGVLASAEHLSDALGEALELSRQPATVATCRERARAFDWDTAVIPALLRVYAS